MRKSGGRPISFKIEVLHFLNVTFKYLFLFLKWNICFQAIGSEWLKMVNGNRMIPGIRIMS